MGEDSVGKRFIYISPIHLKYLVNIITIDIRYSSATITIIN